jgi:hypothetical protein
VRRGVSGSMNGGINIKRSEGELRERERERHEVEDIWI